MSRKFGIFFAVLFMLAAISQLQEGNLGVIAQEVITSTPARVVIPTQGAQEQFQAGVTATWTRTPTVPGPALLQAKEDAGDVNVRSDADINGERIGSIRFGDTYVVLGRRFRWYQFQFDTSPSGRGWVFDELVDIIGDESAIPNLDEEVLPTIDPAISAATETQNAVTLTPGGLLTETANARLLPAPGAADSAPLPGNLPGDTSQVLEGESGNSEAAAIIAMPTYTYPPAMVALAPTAVAANPEAMATENPNDLLNIPLPDNVPPITPIVILAGLGLLGLFISSLRR